VWKQNLYNNSVLYVQYYLSARTLSDTMVVTLWRSVTFIHLKSIAFDVDEVKREVVLY
jgi:hypothetical protein